MLLCAIVSLSLKINTRVPIRKLQVATHARNTALSQQAQRSSQTTHNTHRNTQKIQKSWHCVSFRSFSCSLDRALCMKMTNLINQVTKVT
jgi:hypothetical protein